jgi:hypothetical protein
MAGILRRGARGRQGAHGSRRWRRDLVIVCGELPSKKTLLLGSTLT